MDPQILVIGVATPPIRLTQEQSFYAAGYESECIRKIFLNSDIDVFCLGAYTGAVPRGAPQDHRGLHDRVRTSSPRQQS